VAVKDGFTVTAEELAVHCRAQLAPFKVPQQVDIRETLPMSAVGKILYRVLREEYAAASTGAI
jgi:long-chain acyl-CoA synthetase